MSLYSCECGYRWEDDGYSTCRVCSAATLAAAREENERLTALAKQWEREYLATKDATAGWKADSTILAALRSATPAMDAGRVREPVRWFSEQMERKLAMHDDRPGWLGDYLDSLLERIDDERKELGMVLQWGIANRKQPHPHRVIDEAADIANFCMMIADNMRAVLLAADGPAAHRPDDKDGGGK